jgi:hypothetical protein
MLRSMLNITNIFSCCDLTDLSSSANINEAQLEKSFWAFLFSKGLQNGTDSLQKATNSRCKKTKSWLCVTPFTTKDLTPTGARNMKLAAQTNKQPPVDAQRAKRARRIQVSAWETLTMAIEPKASLSNLLNVRVLLDLNHSFSS